MECTSIRTGSVRAIPLLNVPTEKYLENTHLLQRLDPIGSIEVYRAIHLQSTLYIYIFPGTFEEVGATLRGQPVLYGWYDDQMRRGVVISKQPVPFAPLTTSSTPTSIVSSSIPTTALSLPMGEFVIDLKMKAKDFYIGHYTSGDFSGMPVYAQVLVKRDFERAVLTQMELAENKIAPHIIESHANSGSGIIVSSKGDYITLTRWLFDDKVTQKEAHLVMHNLIGNFMRMKLGLGYDIANLTPSRVVVSSTYTTVLFLDQRDFTMRGESDPISFKDVETFASNLFAEVNEVLNERGIGVSHSTHSTDFDFEPSMHFQTALFVRSFPYDIVDLYDAFIKNGGYPRDFHDRVNTIVDQRFNTTIREKRLLCRYSSVYNGEVILKKSDLYPALVNPRLQGNSMEVNINRMIDDGLEHTVFVSDIASAYRETLDGKSVELWIGEIGERSIAVHHYFSTHQAAPKIIAVWKCGNSIHIIQERLDDVIPLKDYLVTHPDSTALLMDIFRHVIEMATHFKMEYSRLTIYDFYMHHSNVYFKSLYMLRAMPNWPTEPILNINQIALSVLQTIPNLNEESKKVLQKASAITIYPRADKNVKKAFRDFSAYLKSAK